MQEQTSSIPPAVANTVSTPPLSAANGPQEPSTSGPSSNEEKPPEPKLNRKARRHLFAMRQKASKAADAVSRRRVQNFSTLNDWKSRALQSTKLTSDQIDSVFRVALNKLFKKDFKEHLSFERQLSAIVLNVKNGFKYKSDVKPEVKSESQDAVGPVANDPG